MSRFKLALDDGGAVAYGLDDASGFWAEVRRPGRRVAEYNALHEFFNWRFPRDGLLHFLVRQNVFREADLYDALLDLEQPRRGRLSRGAKIALEVVLHLKSAAN